MACKRGGSRAPQDPPSYTYGNINVYHSVQRKIKKDKIQRWWNLTQSNQSTISRLKMQHWSGLLEGSLSLFWNRRLDTTLGRAPTRWAVSINGSKLRSNFSPTICFSFISLLDQVLWSPSGMLSTRILFFRIWFSRNSILLPLISFNDLWMS